MRFERGDLGAVELDRSAFRRVDAGDAAQKRGLAGAVASKNGKEFAIGYFQRNAVQDVAGAVKRSILLTCSVTGTWPFPDRLGEPSRCS